MPQIFLNQVPRTFDPVPATWGELLETLDAGAADAGQLLSAARLDGVDEPSFRDPSLMNRQLAGIGRIEVETAAPTDFLRSCLLHTIEPLERVAEQTQRLAGVYRSGQPAPGHEGLMEVAGELQILTRLIDLMAGPLSLDLSAAGSDIRVHLDALGATLDALVSAQTVEDWMTVADLLEYELEPAIRRWVAILTGVAGALR
jgi:hypothetical protein